MASKLRRKRSNLNPSISGRVYSKEDSKIDFQAGGFNDDSSDDEGNSTTKRRKRREIQDENVSSDEEEEDYNNKSDENDNESDDEEMEETVEAKKVRLAREYLSKVSSKIGDGDTDSSSSDDDEEENVADEGEHANIARKLKKERLKREGTFHRAVASKLQKSILQMYTSIGILFPSNALSIASEDDINTYIPLKFKSEQTSKFQSSSFMKQLRGHDLTPTCVSLHKSGSIAYSGSKDNSVLSWDIEYAKKVSTIIPNWKKTDMEHTKNSGEVLAVANSDDGRYLAVGGRDSCVRIFDVRLLGKSTGNGSGGAAMGKQSSSASLVNTFSGHKGAVTSLAFRTHSLQLFSGSEDRCIRNYNLDQMVYTETLYGHQGPITSLSCHLLARPLSSGRDRTLRAWKISDESHLIFRGGSKASPADCITQIRDDWCLTGHEDGAVNLWFTEKKKPVSCLEWNDYAHAQNNGYYKGSGIVCADALRGSDLAMTGSNDGVIRLWKVKTGKTLDDRGISALARIPVHGFVNGIAIGPKGRFCVAAIGQEHRLGRWERVVKAKNRFAIISLKEGDDDDDDNNEEEGKTSKARENDEMEVMADVELNNEVNEDENDSSDDEDDE